MQKFPSKVSSRAIARDLILYLLPLFISCAKSPEAPVHTPLPNASNLQGCSSANLPLVGTDTDTSVETIVPVPVEKLTFSNILVKSDIPFPTHPLQFLTLSAVVNDTMGGYTHFTITNDVGKKITQIEDVPSSVVRWVPNLPEGYYKISAMPCNSLGCRNDAVKYFVYSQASNNYPTLNNVITLFNQCNGYIHDLQISGGVLIKNAKLIQYYFESASLNLAANDACQSSAATNFGTTSMQNLSSLGAPVVGEILSDPDAIQAEQFQLASANSSSTSTSTSTSTGTSTSTTTTHSSVSSSNTAKVILLSLGIVGIVGGLMAFTTGAVQSKGWTTFTDNLETRTFQIVSDLKTNLKIYDPLKVKSFLETLDPQLKQKIELQIENPKLNFEGTGDVPPKTKTIATQYSNVGKASIALGIGGVLLAVAGIGSLAASSVALDLVSTEPTTSTTTNTQSLKSPFDQGADYINTTVLPLQYKLRQCTVQLYQALQTATP